MQDRGTPRPSAVQLRMAAEYLAYRDKEDVVAQWLSAQAVEQDFEETKQRLAAELGYEPDNEYVVKAARELVETDVPDERI